MMKKILSYVLVTAIMLCSVSASAASENSQAIPLTTTVIEYNGVTLEVPCSVSTSSTASRSSRNEEILTVYVPFNNQESKEYIEEVVSAIHSSAQTRSVITDEFMDRDECMTLKSGMDIDRGTCTIDGDRFNTVRLNSIYVEIVDHDYPLAYYTSVIDATVSVMGHDSNNRLVDFQKTYEMELQSPSYRDDASGFNVPYLIYDRTHGYTSTCEVHYSATIWCWEVDATYGDMVKVTINYTHAPSKQ